MINYIIKAVGLLIIGLLTTACSTTTTPAQPESAICVKLKRELVYHSLNRNHEAGYVTREQKAFLQKRLRDNNCI